MTRWRITHTAPGPIWENQTQSSQGHGNTGPLKRQPPPGSSFMPAGGNINPGLTELLIFQRGSSYWFFKKNKNCPIGSAKHKIHLNGFAGQAKVVCRLDSIHCCLFETWNLVVVILTSTLRREGKQKTGNSETKETMQRSVVTRA